MRDITPPNYRPLRLSLCVILCLCVSGCWRDGDDNDTLVAISDQATTARGVAVTIIVLANDVDVEGREFQVVDVFQGTSGAVTLNPDDTVTYVPETGFDGVDSFVYTLRNDRGATAKAIVTVTVLAQDGFVVRGLLYTLTTIEVPDRVATQSLGINDLGQIVGWYSSVDLRPYLFDDGVFTFPGIALSALAADINDSGDVAGSASPAGYECNGFPNISVGFLWTAAGDLTAFEFPGLDARTCPPDRTYANGINEARQIVGEFRPVSGGVHGFLLDGGMFTQLDPPGATETLANGINDAGQIVGQFSDASGAHGFLLDAGTFTRFDAPGAIATQGEGINDSGQIVGSLSDGAGTHGFLLDSGEFDHFDIPDATATVANGINNLGQIVGSFRFPQPPPETGFVTRGYLATPLQSDPYSIFHDQ